MTQDPERVNPYLELPRSPLGAQESSARGPGCYDWVWGGSGLLPHMP